MQFLHAMIRVRDLEAALRFFCQGLGLVEVRRKDAPAGRYTLVFLAASLEPGAPQIELTHNWDQDAAYTEGRNFGHLAFGVDNIYDTCAHLQVMGVVIARPPRDGYMAFVRSPDNISVELLQRGEPLAPTEPWASMANTGTW